MNQQEEVKKDNGEKKNFSFADAMKKATDVAKKAAGEAKQGVETFVKEQKLKTYRPVTAEEFRSKDFRIPNIIQIVDDAACKKIVIAENAIGFRQNHKSGYSGKTVEIFHLYDEFKDKCGLKFVPAPIPDAVYSVDPFDRTRFIDVTCVFSQAAQEKMAELDHIACCLGAKWCSIEVIDTDHSSNSVKAEGRSTQKITVEENLISPNSKDKLSVEQTKDANSEFSLETARSISANNVSHFSENYQLRKPTLKWFSNDNQIKELIDQRFFGQAQHKTLKLKGANSTTVSLSAAGVIDSLLTINKSGARNKTSFSFSAQSQKESKSILRFEIEFWDDTKKKQGLFAKWRKQK